MINVSVIVPCYNEQATIGQLLDAIYHQSYPKNELEVVIADGLSTDHTREVIKDYAANHPDLLIRVIDNLKRVIPSGLNRAIENAHGKYIVRMDAHSIPDSKYIENCINTLQAGRGENIGGVWIIQPGSATWIAKAIALAAAHPLGAGDARYRIGGRAQEVDTVPFGAYHRDLVTKIGMYDESLLTNEDYEFNARVRESGGRVWMDPSISSIYYARSTLAELAKQYQRYGYWKAQMLRKHPKTLRWRQLIPPLFVLSLIGLAVLSLFLKAAIWLLAFIVLLYGLVIIIIGIQMSIKHSNLAVAIGVPLAFVVIHFSWGSAFLWGLLSKPEINDALR
jgi:glycosyltransferase involved in cell wall biosynthesis